MAFLVGIVVKCLITRYVSQKKPQSKATCNTYSGRPSIVKQVLVISRLPKFEHCSIDALMRFE